MSEQLKQIWPEWEIEKQIGRGAYGVVYQAVRKEFDFVSRSAIKVISIPSDASELESLELEGLDSEASRTYLREVVKDFISEVRVMESLKATSNVVSIEDYRAVEKTDALGWDIYIRMELLTPFTSYFRDRVITEEEVIRLGTDICGALEICEKRKIIHRDIKPENIFVNDFGTFKLGDFGIARKLENMTGGFSQKGTVNYMAPEVVRGTEYDARVDIYSLGIVLYRLLNKNRLPFLETEKQLLSPLERKNAIDRRMRGEALPPPCDASPAMAELILKACAFDPEQRFATAEEMKAALLGVSEAKKQPDPVVIPDQPEDTVPAAAPETMEQDDDEDGTVQIRQVSPEAAALREPAIPVPVAVPEAMEPQDEDGTVQIRQVSPEAAALKTVFRAPEIPERTVEVRRVKAEEPYPAEAAESVPETPAHTEEKDEPAGKKKWFIPLLALLLAICIAGGSVLAWGLQTAYIVLDPSVYDKVYYVGDEVSDKDFFLYRVNNFGQHIRVKDGFVCDPSVLTAAGPESVWVSYKENAAIFEVNVIEPGSVSVPSDTVEVVDDVYDSGTWGSNLTWEVKDGVLTFSGKGKMMDNSSANIYIREDLPWYQYRKFIKSVCIESGITSIGAGTLGGLIKAESITIADTVETVGSGAFDSMRSLTSLHIPAGVKEFSEIAIQNCRDLAEVTVDGNNKYYKSMDGVLYTKDGSVLIHYPAQKTDKTFTIPSSVIWIEWCGFDFNDHLTELNIGENVQVFADSIGLFSKLEKITVASGNQYFTSRDGVLFSKDMKKLLTYPVGKTDTAYSIPDGVETIDSYAFANGLYLETVVISDTVNSIKLRAFYHNSGMKSITVPKSVTYIGYSAFEGLGNDATIYMEGRTAPEYWEDWDEGCEAKIVWNP